MDAVNTRLLVTVIRECQINQKGKHMSGRQKNKGFTLIELLVVIAIIALLLSILMPSLQKAKRVAKRMICMNNTRQTGMSIQLYAESNNGKIMPQCNSNGNPVSNPTTYPPANAYFAYKKIAGVMVPYHLALLYETGVVDSAESFYCPAQSIKDNKNYDYYTKKGTIEWGSDAIAPNKSGNWYVRTSSLYWNACENRIAKLKSFKPMLFDSLSQWDHLPHRKSGPGSMCQGATVLYVDGHVSFVSDPELFTAYTWNGNNYEGAPGNDPVAFQRMLKVLEGR